MRSFRSAILMSFCIMGRIGAECCAGDETSALKEKPALESAKIDFFEQKIRPVLVQHCYPCHATDSKEIRGGLVLDSREGLRIGGDSGPAVVEGHPEDSELLRALRHESVQMPPDQKLSDAVIRDFETWILDGASDPRSGTVAVRRGQIDVELGRTFWSFQPISKVVVPDAGEGWVRNEVDHFIAAGHRAEGLSMPPQDAPPEVILKRLYLTLTGLLPSPQEQRDFATGYAQSPDIAIAEVVDRLLNSPRYAERWGRHWLDVVRFAESTGGGRSMMFPDAWRFRDYVIRSFQNDRPFPELIREHLAGDLLPSASDSQHDEQLTGAGYLMLGAINYEEQDKEQLRMDVVDEQIDSMGRTFLGMTLGCARCHDHKFDPIPTADYYALAGIFRSTRSLTPGNVCGWVTKPLRQGADQAAIEAWAARDRELEQQIAELKKKPRANASAQGKALSKLPGIVVDDSDAVLEGEWTPSMFQPPFIGEGYRHSGMPRKGLTATYPVRIPADDEYLVRMVVNHGASRSEQVPVLIFHADGETQLLVNQKVIPPGDGVFTELGRFRFEASATAKVIIKASDAAPGHVIIDAIHFVPASQLSDPGQGEALAAAVNRPVPAGDPLKAAEDLRKEHAKTKPIQPVAMCVNDETEVGDWHLHIRGEIRNPGPIVPRGFLQVATQGSMARQLSPAGKSSSGRAELAEWIASSDNPLTARVWVNRLWLNVMGAGIVRTPDNFGQTGQKPTHPELLDYLAWTLIHADQWSTKAMLRRLCTSRTFRMSSIAAHGRETSDPENHCWTHSFRRRLDAESLRDCMLQTSGRLDLSVIGGPRIAKLSTYDNEYRHEDYPMNCRSIFVPVFRNTMLDLFEIFDAANPNSVTGIRTQSNRPAQALYMMNSPFVVEQSRHAAEYFLGQQDLFKLTIEQQVQLAVQSVLCRQAADAEILLLCDIVRSNPESADLWATVFHALYSSIDFRYIH